MNKINVLLVNPSEEPKVVEMDNTLTGIYETIKCKRFCELYISTDQVAILCDDNGMFNYGIYNYNRIVKDGYGEDHRIYGPFLVCYAPARCPDYSSLPDNLIDKYKEILKL